MHPSFLFRTKFLFILLRISLSTPCVYMLIDHTEVNFPNLKELRNIKTRNRSWTKSEKSQPKNDISFLLDLLNCTCAHFFSKLVLVISRWCMRPMETSFESGWSYGLLVRYFHFMSKVCCCSRYCNSGNPQKNLAFLQKLDLTLWLTISGSWLRQFRNKKNRVF